jgi:NAD(P)-dependent dehydrogenase (short-subunit alcohol dehydrogenase family)
MVIIVGASGGIGSYLVDHMGRDYEIIGTYNKNRPKVQNSEANFYEVNINDADSISTFLSSIESKLKQITLINLAGISIDSMCHKMDNAAWDEVLNTNLRGTFFMCRALLPFMRAQGYGRIINFSSIVGQLGIPGTVAYSASKSGLFGLTRTLAAENAVRNITVNALALGYFEVGIINVIPKDIQEKIRNSIPMRRLGHPRNIELAIRFLIECDYITGAVININGGLYG